MKISQLLVDAYGCSADLNDDAFLLDLLERAAEAARSHVVEKVVHRYPKEGVTVILILAETHLSVHTWPELEYAAVDVFICGEGRDPYAAWGVIREGLGPASFEEKEIYRTIGRKGEGKP
ncbi:S-adenosylmethionine decarboxylase proenzyme [subsurface metagenome]